MFFCLCINKDNLIYFLNIFRLFICCWAFKKKKRYLWNMYMCVNSGMFFFSMVLCEYQMIYLRRKRQLFLCRKFVLYFMLTIYSEFCNFGF